MDGQTSKPSHGRRVCGIDNCRDSSVHDDEEEEDVEEEEEAVL